MSSLFVVYNDNVIILEQETITTITNYMILVDFLKEKNVIDFNNDEMVSTFGVFEITN